MKDLVFIKEAGSRAEPYTTTEILSECMGISYHATQQLVRKYKTELESFGLLEFEMRAVKRKRGVKHLKIYHLNEQQATLLITMTRNTPAVIAFKKELVRQFFLMREELTHRKILRAEGKPKRRSLTDAIRDSGEQERMKGHAFAAYTNLAYKAAMGQTAAQLRRARGADRKAVAADFLTSDELTAYQKQETAIAALLDIGQTYDSIKTTLLRGTTP